MIDKLKQLIIKYKELITYVIFGVLTTLVSWVTYALVVKISPSSINNIIWVTISSAISWVAGVLFAFITNKLWVFESKSFAPKTVAKELVSFVAARGITGAFEVFVPSLLIKIGIDQTIFGIEGAVAKLIVSVVVVILNYVFSKLIVFKKKK